jgi:UDP-N-acetylmuramyl pentapeptide synthase
VVSGALTGGLQERMALAYTDRDALATDMKRLVKPGDVVLVKGSRGMRMELVLDKFLEEK